MSQIHAALSHYWHLRDQGLSPDNAVAHVKQRYGIVIDREQMNPDAAQVIDSGKPTFEVGQWIDGGPIHKGPVEITKIVRVDGKFLYALRWPDEEKSYSYEVVDWDVESWVRNSRYHSNPWKPVRAVASPKPTMRQVTSATSNPQGLMGTVPPKRFVRVTNPHSTYYGRCGEATPASIPGYVSVRLSASGSLTFGEDEVA